jgi:hypothetical protein
VPEKKEKIEADKFLDDWKSLPGYKFDGQENQNDA